MQILVLTLLLIGILGAYLTFWYFEGFWTATWILLTSVLLGVLGTLLERALGL